MIFIDTNIFIRFFVVDNSEEHKKVEKFFNDVVCGNTKYFTNTMVITEIVWVLGKYYKMEKNHVCENIRLILDTPNILIKEIKILHNTVEIFEKQNIDFIDAYNYSYSLMSNSNEIMSYDKDFDKLDMIKRIEP